METELMNESSKLIAQAIQLLKDFNIMDGPHSLDESVKLLEDALGKLTQI